MSIHRLILTAAVLTAFPAAMLHAQQVSTLEINLKKAGAPVQETMYGIFFEDISYAADGGLYAELVQNRDFEYNSKDRREWTSTTAWHSSHPIQIATDNPLSSNNPHYAIFLSKMLAQRLVLQAQNTYIFQLRLEEMQALIKQKDISPQKLPL